MADNKDIYKIAVSVVLIHLMLLFVFEGFLMAGQTDNSIVNNALDNVFKDAGGVSGQISDIGLCLEGTATQSECEANGCVWDNNQCFNAIEDRTGVDFGFFDVLLSIMKIPIYLGKIILFLGSIVFFELILSFKLMPLITVGALRFLVSVSLWTFQMVVLYYLWAFISNWRGQRQ